MSLFVVSPLHTVCGGCKEQVPAAGGIREGSVGGWVLFACKHQTGPAGLCSDLRWVLRVGGTDEVSTLSVAIWAAVPAGLLCLRTGRQQLHPSAWDEHNKLGFSSQAGGTQVLELWEAVCNILQHSPSLCKERLTACLLSFIIPHQWLYPPYSQKEKEERISSKH